jgi:hypothetical protein
MKKVQLLCLLLLLLAVAATAQDTNPFKSIGKKGKIVTLSHGRYEEVFDTDTIQRIGSVLYNTRTGRVVKLLNEKEVYQKYSDNSTSSRWYSVDPLADQFAQYSPYNFCLNNPIKFVDANGMAATSTHTDSLGNVLAVFNDGDNGVYKHDGNSTAASVTKDHSKKNTSAGGTKMGETEYWDEFINPDNNKPEGRIDFGQTWDKAIDKLHDDALDMDLMGIAKESHLHGALDLKNNTEYAPHGPMTGKLYNGKYMSARSAGNFLAGANGRSGTYFGCYISLLTYMKLAGALQQNQYSTGNAVKIFFLGTSYGSAPYYGEMEYSGRMIINGWHGGLKLLKDEN